MNKLSWIIFSAVTVGALGLLVYFSGSSKIDINGVDTNAIQTANNNNGNIADHVYGKVGSKVILINYSDFQCPGCGSAHPLIKPIVEEYKDQIQFVFRNFPIPDSHPNAKAAAGSAEAAGLQGKFWEMHDKILESQADWESLAGTDRSNFFANQAKSLGLDVDKFNTDVASSPVNKKINFDKAIGVKAGVDATPSFYLNGTRLDSKVWGDETKLKEVINAELKKAGIELPTDN